MRILRNNLLEECFNGASPAHNLIIREVTETMTESRAGGARRRILLLLPFVPRLDSNHGGARVIAQLVSRLSKRHCVAMVYIRAADEARADEENQSAHMVNGGREKGDEKGGRQWEQGQGKVQED